MLDSNVKQREEQNRPKRINNIKREISKQERIIDATEIFGPLKNTEAWKRYITFLKIRIAWKKGREKDLGKVTFDKARNDSNNIQRGMIQAEISELEFLVDLSDNEEKKNLTAINKKKSLEAQLKQLEEKNERNN